MTHDELVEKMCEAFDPLSRDMNGSNPYRQAMSAALRVAVEEVLGEVSDKEYEPIPISIDRGYGARCPINDMLANRRSRYLKPKSEEERVTVEKDYGAWNVYLDEKLQDRFQKGETAEIYRLGLIGKLKEKENAQR